MLSNFLVGRDERNITFEDCKIQKNAVINLVLTTLSDKVPTLKFTVAVKEADARHTKQVTVEMAADEQIRKLKRILHEHNVVTQGKKLMRWPLKSEDIDLEDEDIQDMELKDI